MKHWRCWNPACTDHEGGRLGHDFFSDVPVCDKCGTDGRIKLFSNVIAKLEITHFNLPTHIPGLHHGRVACDPQKWKKVVSNNPNVVTCSICKKSAEWKKAMEEYNNTEKEEVEVDGHKDFHVEVDLKEQVYRKVEDSPAS